MRKKTKSILILSGSPKKSGNTTALAEWFIEGALAKKAKVELIHTAFLKYKFPGLRFLPFVSEGKGIWLCDPR